MRRLRVVCYAINGRGLGHLTRQLAIARWMRRYAEVLDVGLELWVLTSSEADTLARREGFPALKLPSKAMLRDAGVDLSRGLTIARAWVLQSVALLQPDLLIVDTFPGGTYGELLATLELAPKRALVARPVRASMAEDPGYSGLLPLYQTVLVPDDAGSPGQNEPGELGPILLREREELLPRDAARRALGVPDGQRAVWLSLGGGGDPAAMSTLPRLVDALRG
ncbi:UDP-glucosyltransferase, partial [Myxococcota bacterium]|nr:UDP-glucosyltransferase [Myxococcota bacterium]